MGCDIGELLGKKEISLDFLNGRTIGIDSYNILYQFISIIRGADGSPLMDSHGNITSHLSGILYRTGSLVEKGIKPVFVFDGKPHKLKSRTLKERTELRKDAKEKYEAALKEGEIEEARKFAVRSTALNEKTIEDAKKLIKLLGFPVIQAKAEGEAQIAVMCSEKKLYGCVSQDYDALLFGSPILLRNITVSGKKKLPKRNAYIDVKPEIMELEIGLRQLGIDRKKLIWLGILIGTDFNEKFPRIGPKTALKLVKENNSFEEIIKQTGFEPEFDYKEIEEIFLNPEINKEYELKFDAPQEEKIISFLVEEHDFNEERAKNALKKFSENDLEKAQSRINRWF